MKSVFPSQKNFFHLMAPAAAAVLCMALTLSDARAGSIGGPPPFRDGSPLISGVDGSYQAIARSKNITGIFRFQYQNGVQTSSSANNVWVFFVEGRPQRGNVTAAINGSNLAGVLDSGTANFATNTNANTGGTLQFPIVIQNQQAQSVGQYNGKLQLNNPYGTFHGTGSMNPAPPQTNQYVIVDSNGGVTSIDVTNGGFTGTTNWFKFSGVRTTVSTPTITATPTPIN